MEYPPTENGNLAQKKEISYGNLQTAQSKNLKPPSNYGNQFNYQYGPPVDVRGVYPNGASSSAGQNSNPNYGGDRNAVPNQFDAANPTRTNNVALTAKTVNVANARQLPNVNYGNVNTPQHSINPTEYQNVDDSYNQYQNSNPNLYKNQRSISANYNHNGDDDDQKYAAYSTYDGNSRVNNEENSVQKNYNNKEESLQKCQQKAGDSRVSDQDEDSRREKELYKFITRKLNEEYDGRSQKPNNDKNSKQNFNDVQSRPFSEDVSETYSLPSSNSNKKYNQYKSVKIETNGLNTNPALIANKYRDDETQSANSRKDNHRSKNSQAAKTKENSATDDFADDGTENYDQSLNNNLQYKNVPSAKKQAPQDRDDTHTLNKQEDRNIQAPKKQAKFEDYDEIGSSYGKQNNKRYKTKQSEKTQAEEPNYTNGNNQEENDEKVTRRLALGNNNSMKQNKVFARQPEETQQQKYGQEDASDENDDKDDPDKYLPDEDYEESYKNDLSDVQSRRNNNPSDQNDSDCDSNEVVINRPALKKSFENLKQGVLEAEEVDVTVRSGLTQKVLIGEHTRVCYACSSASNPTCLKPTRHTTVKYCHRGHDSCVTKIFKANGMRFSTFC